MLTYNKKGQATLEYAVLVSVAIVAFISMLAPLKRSIQGKIANAGDQISSEKYSPGQVGLVSSWSYSEDLKDHQQPEYTYSENRNSERVWIPDNGKEYFPAGNDKDGNPIVTQNPGINNPAVR